MNHREMEKSVNGHAGPVIPILDRAIAAGASDIHLRPERSPRIRVNTILNPLKDFFLTSEEILDFGKSFLTDYKLDELRDKGEVDASLGYRDRRFRANLFAQKDGYTLALRMIPMEIPSMEDLNLPEVLKDLCEKKRGLILVTGPTGSGKTTTLAAMINYINARRKENIVTIEDPIEYLYKEQESMISQRELGAHTRSFANALRASLRQDPDIILVGEMCDLDTISVALTAAETGHVVLSTLHTVGAANSMDRIIDVFPAHQQAQVRTQLSNVIEAVVSQQLMASISGNEMIPAIEVMLGTPAVRNVIREGKTHQILSIQEGSAAQKMITMDRALVNLYRRGLISKDTALQYSVDRTAISREIGMQVRNG